MMPTEPEIEYNSERFRTLALYLASRSMHDPAFGKTKLAKLLFYCDFTAYGELGESITGARYLAYPRGPYPQSFEEELRAIEASGAGFVVLDRYYDREQQRLVSRQEPDMSEFTGPQMALVERTLAMLRDEDARSLSAKTHAETGWQSVNAGDAIPYDTVFVSYDPPSEALVRAGRNNPVSVG